MDEELADLGELEDYLQDLEEFRDLLGEPGWVVFKEQVLDRLAERWARLLEAEDRMEMVRIHQGGIRFYRQLLNEVERLTEDELNEVKEQIEVRKHG